MPLLNFLVLNRGNQPEPRRPLLRWRWLNSSVWGVQWTLGIYLLVTQLSHANSLVALNRNMPAKVPMYGIWSVDEFLLDGQLRPPLLTDNLRWQRVIFDSEPMMLPRVVATVQNMSGEFSSYVATLDTHNNLLWKSPTDADLDELRSLNHMTTPGHGNAEMSYSRVSPGAMVLDGVMDGHQLRLMLRKEERQFTLNTLRFRWVTQNNEMY